MNSKKMQQMMKRMGINQLEIPANEVIIRQNDKEIIINSPNVSKVNIMGQETYQVIGEATERAISSMPEINEEDINTVIEQTGADRERVKKTLKETKGDLAEAIIKLKKEESFSKPV